jgi:2-oxoisovalerate dehydrogenase E1 component
VPGSTILDFHQAHEFALERSRYPVKLSREALYAVAYPVMLLSRRLEERLSELFEKGYVKGTVTMSAGNEATALGMSLPLRPGRDVVSLLHRDFPAHLILGAEPYHLLCQYMANAQSPTHAREGNCHHGDAGSRRFPMMSHLGKMLSTVVGGTWAARRHGEEVFGLAVIGDGGTSTGEFHESLNLAAVHKVPVVFAIENNHYAFSTPTSSQFCCRRLSDRAVGYGVSGRTIDGTDPWEVYTAFFDALDGMRDDSLPRLIECMSLRLYGHAAYDKAKYVPEDLLADWWRHDPLALTRRKLIEVCGYAEAEIARIEAAIESEVQTAVAAAMKVGRPEAPARCARVHSPSPHVRRNPFEAAKLTNGDAVNRALDYLLADNPHAFLAGMDVGTYGSAFKTCKGLVERFGPGRVIDMPICESAIIGFALGASQVGAEPIIEFQFADFSTEAVSQLGLNAGTWYFRSGSPVPMLVRLPCGGGLTLGAFHSGEFEGLWSRFPGLKLLYPATPQETFEALVAGFYDRNPCLVFEHKHLYWSRRGDVRFDGDLESVWRSRRYTEGDRLTLVAWGAMVHDSLAAAARVDRGVEVWNPFVLQPLDPGPILESVRKTGRLLVVQEAGETQGLGDRIISLVAREGLPWLKCPPRLVASPDSPVPFAPELESQYRPNPTRILAAIEQMLPA